MAWLLNFIQKVFFFPKVDGRFYLLYFIVVTKFSDTGAYIVGSLIGRHKLIPRLSPGKTIEGVVGGLALGVGVALGTTVGASVGGAVGPGAAGCGREARRTGSEGESCPILTRPGAVDLWSAK